MISPLGIRIRARPTRKPIEQILKVPKGAGHPTAEWGGASNGAISAADTLAVMRRLRTCVTRARLTPR